MKKTMLLLLLYGSTRAFAQTQTPKDLPVVVQALKQIDRKSPAYNPEAAYPLFIQGAQQGSVRSMNALGVMYSRGLGITASFEEAVKWFEKAAINNYPESWYNWGLLYKEGAGTTQDFKKAYEIFSNGAEKGYASAQYAQGFMTYKGFGCKQDYAKAALLFKQSAKQGHTWSMYMLGLCYRNGYGLDVNTDSATYWLTVAANRGYRNAREELAKEKPENSFSLTESNERIAKETERYAKDHASLQQALIEKIRQNNSENKLEGSYSGYITRYDWSGEHVIGQSRLNLYLEANGKVLNGQWIEDDTITTAVYAVLKDSSLVFSNTNYVKREHYGKQAGVNFEFRDASLKLITIADSVFLAGKLQLFSIDLNEPEKPIYINLAKDQPGGANSTQMQVVTKTKAGLQADAAHTVAADTRLQVFPNPFASSFQVSFNMQKAGDVAFILSDITGKVCYQDNVTLDIGRHSKSIDIQKMPSGAYILKVVYNGKIDSQIVIKN